LSCRHFAIAWLSQERVNCRFLSQGVSCSKLVNTRPFSNVFRIPCTLMAIGNADFRVLPVELLQFSCSNLRNSCAHMRMHTSNTSLTDSFFLRASSAAHLSVSVCVLKSEGGGEVYCKIVCFIETYRRFEPAAIARANAQTVVFEITQLHATCHWPMLLGAARRLPPRAILVRFSCPCANFLQIAARRLQA
jgi:hypothetical protein